MRHSLTLADMCYLCLYSKWVDCAASAAEDWEEVAGPVASTLVRGCQACYVDHCVLRSLLLLDFMLEL